MATKSKKKEAALTGAILYREQWLAHAADAMRPWFEEKGKPLAEKIQYAVAVPTRRQAIGQCFDAKLTKNGTWHIIIDARMEDPVRVLDVLLHELCHVALGLEASHDKEFKNLAMKQFGLTGKATATVCEPGSPLHAQLVLLAEQLGTYPHAPFSPPRKGSGGSKSWVRLKSVNEETYTCVVSIKNINEHGWPVDPWGERMILQKGHPEIEEPEEGEEE